MSQPSLEEIQHTNSFYFTDALPFSLPSSSRPRCNKCLYLSRKTSPFKQLQQKTSRNFQPYSADCFNAPHPTRKNFEKERKTMRSSASLNTHHLLTNSRHAHNTSALPTSIRPRRTNPALRSLSI
jgi:hypothetical protein